MAVGKTYYLDRIYRINWIIIHRRVAENAEAFYLAADIFNVEFLILRIQN